MQTNTLKSTASRRKHPCNLSRALRKSAERALSALLLSALAAPVGADSYFWDSNGSGDGTGGAGQWNKTTLDTWRSGSAAGTLTNWIDGNDAVFGGTSGNVTLGTSVSATGLSFSTSGYVIPNSTNRTITLTGNPTVNLSSGVVTTLGTWVTATSGTPILKGSAGMTVDGGGELILASGLQNSLSGGVKVTGNSILTLGDRSQPTSSTVSINGGGTGSAGYFGGNDLAIDDGTVRLAASTGTGASLSRLGNITIANTGTFVLWRTGTSGTMGSDLTASNTTGNVTMSANSVLTVATGGNTSSATLALGNLTATGAFTLKGQPGANSAKMSFNTMSDGGYQMTILGGGSGTVKGIDTRLGYAVTGSSFTGSLVLGNATGNQGALYSVDGSESTKLTSGNITIYPYSQLAINFSGNFGTSGSTLMLNGKGNITDTGTGNIGAIRSSKALSTTTWLGNTVLGSDATIYAESGNTFVLDGNVSGGFQLRKAGTGILVVNGTNAGYTGSTWVSDGSLIVNSGSRIGTGSLKVGDDAGIGSVVVNLNNAAQNIGSLTQGSASVSRTINLGTNHALTIVQSTPGSFGGTITGSTGSITLDSASSNTFTLSGTNTYGGGTFVNGGLLVLGHGSDTLHNSGAVTVGGGVVALGSNSDAVGAVTLTSGSITSSTGTLTGTSYDVRAGIVSAKLGGPGITLSKTTAGTVTLSGANSYTGSTSVTGGTLLVTGSTNTSSAVTVGDGSNLGTGKLGGTGVVHGTVRVKKGGTIAAGADDGTIGTLNTGSQTWDGGGKFYVKLNSTAAGGVMASDKLAMSGLTVNAASGNKFIIVVQSFASMFDGSKDYTWTIATGNYSDLASPENLEKFSLDTSAFAPASANNYAPSNDNSSASGRFQLAFGGAGVALSYTAAPEPTTLLLLGAAIVPLGMGRRRRYLNRNQPLPDWRPNALK